MSARFEGERWPGDCECGHPFEGHAHDAPSERCLDPDCECEDYHRTLFHWLLDKIGQQ